MTDLRSRIRILVPALGALVLLGAAPAAMAATRAVPQAAGAQVTPTSWNAGAVFDGQSKTRTIRLTNTGNRTLRLGLVSVSEDIDFATTTNHCQSARLAPGRSCTVTVRFSPTGHGTRTATLGFENATNTAQVARVPLRGIALQPGPGILQVVPASWEAGTVPVGQTTSRGFIATNVGGQRVGIGNVSISEDRDFSGGGGQCQGASLAPGQSCITSVRFTPTFGPGPDTVDRSASLFFLDPSTNATLAQVPLHGTVQP